MAKIRLMAQIKHTFVGKEVTEGHLILLRRYDVSEYIQMIEIHTHLESK